MIKLFAKKEYLTQKEDYDLILFPFWGVSPKEKGGLFPDKYNQYINKGKEYFQLTDIDNCDFVVWPEKYNPNKIVRMKPLIDLSKKYSKPIIIFYTDDSAGKIDIPNSYVFRTSLYRKNRDRREFSLPFFNDDLANIYFSNNLIIKEKRNIPSVGYCGYTRTMKDLVKGVLGIDYGVWRKIRYQAVNNLKHNPKIKSDFIIRNDFFGGAYEKHNLTGEDLKEKIIKVRSEYVTNLVSNDYDLVTRGRGNFSIRFYEIFNLGRIPLFIDSDCVLPYENFIKYNDLLVKVDISEIDRIDKILLDFNNNISNDDFKKMQEKIRETWIDWLSPDGFFKHFDLNFK